MVKINRLLEMTICLLNKGTVTAKELADRFGVSTRTIYRDIDVLSGAGVPVYTNRGSGGGISLLDSYTLNKALISKHESESLTLALKTLKATKYPEIDAVLEKIGAVFKNSASDWVDIDFSFWGSSPNEKNKFIDIKMAILERKIISFTYVNAEGGRSSRSIEPIQLIFKSRAWYLRGYCTLRKDFRTFRISRMKNLLVTGETFARKRPEAHEKLEAEEYSRMPVDLTLEFYPQALPRIYDDFDDELITRNADGTCTVTVTFPEDEWVYGYLMSFGCYVKVVEPPHIQKIIADRMRSAMAFYEGEN
jgi:predicted DNA-binding transcriptional regulator YafY